MDDNPLIVTCTHLMERTDGPDMIFVDGGRVTIAVCFVCADATNERHFHGVMDPLPSFRPLCPEHAQEAHIPVATKMVDGFYERQDGQWVRQPSDGEVKRCRRVAHVSAGSVIERPSRAHRRAVPCTEPCRTVGTAHAARRG